MQISSLKAAQQDEIAQLNAEHEKMRADLEAGKKDLASQLAAKTSSLVEVEQKRDSLAEELARLQSVSRAAEESAEESAQKHAAAIAAFEKDKQDLKKQLSRAQSNYDLLASGQIDCIPDMYI